MKTELRATTASPPIFARSVMTIVREAVGEVFLLRVIAHVCEWSELSQKITVALKEILTTGEHMDAGSKRITDKVWRSILPTGHPVSGWAPVLRPAWDISPAYNSVIPLGVDFGV